MTLDPAAVLALSAEPWLGEAAFLDRLESVIGPLGLDHVRMPDRLKGGDPVLWSVTGRFGAPLSGTSIAGGIFACARYGIATRDRLAESALSDPDAFALFAAVRPDHDDAEAWPDTGVARLSCMITWDDTRRVAIIPEAAARAAVDAVFATVTRSGDAEAYGAGWRDYAPLYGEDGYRIEGRDGIETSVIVQDRAMIALRVSHQTIRFRSFLLGGGV